MAEFEAIGKALQIPQSVLNNIEKIDQKINLIASDSEKMATHFMSAMTRMGNGANDLLQKLNAIQSVVGKLDLSKFSQSVTTVGQGTTQVEQFAAAIAKAAEAINKYNAENRKSADVDNSKQIAQLNKEIEAMRKRTQQLEEYINKQRQANQGGGRRGGSSSGGTNSDTKALNAYNRAMAASEALVTQRINKIAKLRNAEEQLRATGRNYQTQLQRIQQEIARLNKLNDGQVDAYGRVIRSQRNLVNTSQQLTRQLALLFSVSQIEGYISKLVQVRGEFELQQVALTSILQNKDQADQLFAQITDLAVRSPFTIKELTTYTKSLAAYQVQYEDLYDTTKMLADVSAGLGVDMQRLILAFGQVKAANFLRGTETRQFTEAGINMLGELSKYYTELEGRIVSVQEVQDRQFKRMISFQDVEEVFKRLTSAGGMFYNMQERQAETLAGQMSNLRDQFDLMFNEIGKDNQGSINVVISSIKLLIENWEIFANILKASAVGWTTYTATTLLAAAANGKFATSAIAATASAKGLVGITAKLITSMKAFGTFLKTNPITIIATALASAVYFWNDHRKAVEENRKAYDPLVNSINRTITAVDELTKKIGEQNDRIRTANDNVGQYEKGTSEYARAEANANEEREKQNRLLEELETKYPEIYNGIIRQKDGTVDYTNALKEFNGQLEQQNYLNYLARQTATGGDNGLLADASNAAEAQQKLKIATENADNALILMMSRMREYFATNQYASQDLKKQLDEIANSSLSSGEKIYKMFNMIINEHGVNIGALKDIAWDFVDVGREAMKASNEAEDANERLAESSLSVAENYKKSVIDTGKVSREESQKNVEAFLKNIGIQNQAVLDFIKQQFEVEIGVKINLEPTPKSLGGFEKQINDYLDEHQFTLIGRIQPGGDADKFFDNLSANLSDYKKELEQVTQATEQLYASEGKTNEQRAEELRNIISQIETTQKAFGRFNETSKGGGRSSSKDPILDRFKEIISLIEEAKKRYDELNAEFDSEVATQMVRTQFADTPAGDIIATMTFDAQGVVNGLNKAIQATGKAAQEEYRKAFQDASRPFETKLLLDPQIEKREKLEQQIEDMFDQYDLSIQLSASGVPTNVIEELFGTKIVNLETLKAELEKIRPILEKEGSNWNEILTKAEKEYWDRQKKEVEDAVRTYAEQMKKSISERALLEIEAQKKIAAIRTSDKLSPETKNAITGNIRQQTDIEIGKLNWENFQNSDIYQRLFQNLEYMSTESIERIRRKLDELRNDMGNLSPENLKTINEYYQKLEDVTAERNPFAAMRDSLKEINELRSQGRTEDFLNEELLRLDQDKTTYEQQINDLETIIGMKEQGLSLDNLSDDLLIRNNNLLNESTESLRMQLSIRKQQLGKTNTEIGITQKDLNSYVKARNNASKLSVEIQSIQTLGKTAFGSISEIMDSMGEGMDENEKIIADMAGGLLDLVSQAVMFGIQLQVNTAMAEVFGTTLNAALGPIGWAVMALQALTMIFSAFSKMHDNKREQQIEKEQEAVDYLEKSYKKLYNTIENGLSIYSYSDNSKLIDNLRRQIESYQRMIALEYDKKDTDYDRIKDWKDTISDLYEQMNELYANLKDELVGDFKDAASQLADALVEAFESGEDAAGKWGDTVRDIMVEILTNVLSMKYIEPAVQEILDNMFDQAMPLTSNAENIKNELDKKKAELEKLMSEGNPYKLWTEDFDNWDNYVKNLKNEISELEKKHAEANKKAEGEIPNITGDIVDSTAGQLNDLLESVVDSPIADLIKQLYGQAGAGGDTLTGLSKSISGLSEQQADALAALCESIRFFTSDSNAVLHSIYNFLLAPPAESPLMQEMRVQTTHLSSIDSLLGSVIKNSSGKGRIMRVEIV